MIGNAQKRAEMQCFKGFELLLTDPTDFIAFFTIFHNAFSATVEVSKPFGNSRMLCQAWSWA
jgi:hypothetical protein